MALTVGRDGEPQLVDFLGQLFFAGGGLFLRGFECTEFGLLFGELIAH